LVGEVGEEFGGDGAGEREDGGGIWRKKVPESRWGRTRHLSVGGEEPRDMMAFVGQ
jgi:hypothetical protein